MNQKTILYGCVLCLLAFFYKDASAIPAYARQTGKSCLQCHSPAVPQLKFEGRKFKVLNYTEVNPDYEYLPDLELLKKTAPFAVRSRFTPVNWENGAGWALAPEWELDLYGGSRISEKGGVFAQVSFASDMPMPMVHQLKINYRLATLKEGKGYWGIAGGVGTPVGFDIYNSINPMLRVNRVNPYIFPHGHMGGGMDMDGQGSSAGHHGGGGGDEGPPPVPDDFFQIANPGNMGVVTNLWVAEKLWLNTGVFRGLSGTDPDFWGRIAFEPLKTTLMVGAYAYIGKEGEDGMIMTMNDTMTMGTDTTIMPMKMMMGGKSDVLRAGIDFELEKTFGPEFIKVMGAYSYIKDIKPSGEMVKMNEEIPDEEELLHGGYLQAMWLHDFFMGGAVGPVIQYDYMENLMTKGNWQRLTVGVKYYIRPNINVSPEFVLNLSDTDDMLFGLSFDADF